MPDKKRVQIYKNTNQCIQCGQPLQKTDKTNVTCADCISKNKKTFMAVRQNRKKNKQCVQCGQPLQKTDKTNVTCAKCISKNYAWKRKLLHKRKTNNLCLRCGSKQLINKMHCKECNIKYKIEVQKKVKSNKIQRKKQKIKLLNKYFPKQ